MSASVVERTSRNTPHEPDSVALRDSRAGIRREGGGRAQVRQLVDGSSENEQKCPEAEQKVLPWMTAGGLLNALCCSCLTSDGGEGAFQMRSAIYALPRMACRKHSPMPPTWQHSDLKHRTSPQTAQRGLPETGAGDSRTAPERMAAQESIAPQGTPRCGV